MNNRDLNLLKKDLTIDDAMTVIGRLEDNSKVASKKPLVKWKSYRHQVVVEGENHFYKVYEVEKGNTLMFDHYVRVALAQVMQEMGINWSLISFERGMSIFDFEQKPKLTVAAPEKISFADILVSISDVYSRVQEILEFDSIQKQLKTFENFKSVKKLQLTRSCVNKHDDYAFIGDQAVLLDDADFYIALVDGDGDVLDVQDQDEIRIETTYGRFRFLKLKRNFNETRENSASPDELERNYHGWVLVPELVAEGSTNIDTAGTIVLSNKTTDLVQQNVSEISHQVEISALVHDKPRADSFLNEDIANCDVFIESNLDDPLESDLYTQLEKLADSSKDVCVHTFLNMKNHDDAHQDFDVWSSHMRAIDSFYPKVKKLTTVILSNDFCERYLEEDLTMSKFSGKHGTLLEFCPPTDKNSYPTRTAFRKFLLSFLKKEPNLLQTMLPSPCSAFGSSGIQESEGDRQSESKNPFCEKKHGLIFNCYSDCQGCMMCDFEKIKTALPL